MASTTLYPRAVQTDSLVITYSLKHQSPDDSNYKARLFELAQLTADPGKVQIPLPLRCSSGKFHVN